MVARWQLLPLGVSDEAIQHRVERRRWLRRRPGVYQIGHGRLTHRGRWLADVLTCGEGARLGGTSVLELLDVRRPSNRRTVVMTTKRGRRKPRGIDLRWPRRNRQDMGRDPISPLHIALVEAARDLDDEQLEAAYEKAVTKWELPPDLIPKRNSRLNQLIKDHERGTALTDSDLENLFRTTIKRAGLPQPESSSSRSTAPCTRASARMTTVARPTCPRSATRSSASAGCSCCVTKTK